MEATEVAVSLDLEEVCVHRRRISIWSKIQRRYKPGRRSGKVVQEEDRQDTRLWALD